MDNLYVKKETVLAQNKTARNRGKSSSEWFTELIFSYEP